MLVTSLVGCAGLNISGPLQTTVDVTTSAQVAQKPATEKLTAWNSEFRRDIIQVADNVCAASGDGASVFTMIEGTDGIIMIDTDQEPDVSREALAEFRNITNKPVCAVNYTHGLEAAGRVHREVYAVVPPKVEYSLTKKGETLKPILLSLKDWDEKHVFDS